MVGKKESDARRERAIKALTSRRLRDPPLQRALLVSNDEMRDHHFQMLSTSTLQRWKERHHAHFEIGGAPDAARLEAAANAAAEPMSSRPKPGAREVRVYAPPSFSVRTQHIGMSAPPLEGGPGIPEQFWFFPEGAALVDHTRQRGTQGASTTKVERTRADSEWLCFLPAP